MNTCARMAVRLRCSPEAGYHNIVDQLLLLLLLLSHFSHVRLCATLWRAAHQAPLSTGFSRHQLYLSTKQEV